MAAFALPLLAGLALTAAGSVYNAKQQASFARAQQRAEDERQQRERAAREAERRRQRAIEAQGVSNIRQEMVALDPAARADLIAENAAAEDNPITTAGDRFEPLPRGTDVAGSVLGNAGKLRDEAARTKQQLAAMAILSGQSTDGTAAFQRLLRLNDASGGLASKARRSASVADFEAAVPGARVTPSNSILGDLAIVGGQLASGVGGSRLAKWTPFGV